MKCPLTTAIDYEDELITNFHTADCLEEECAWWDKANVCCVVCHINSIAEVLKFFLKDIRDGVTRRGEG